ncbi:hypothetical protein ACHHYP_15515 [Achlya hypogyna]|uniref:Pentacotripeptide-repeat region of PRORP domain-containing protein n=1 Tax=Achlya hypogyna TaxID=1202772 RepID=A0A1V9YAR9_ACHHY|nr:hypothetical protein ACHHYP_15515 [Achlya hypogyna]
MKRLPQYVAQSTRALLDRVRKEKIPLSRNEFNKLIADAGRAFSSREAAEALELMSAHMRPCPASHGGVLQSLVRENEHDAAMRYFNNLLSADIADPRLYSMAINSCGYHGDLQTATALFASMKARGINPTGHTYQGLLQACVATSDIATAEGFWAEMQAANVVPTRGAVKALLTVYRDAAIAARKSYLTTAPPIDAARIRDIVAGVRPLATDRRDHVAFPSELVAAIAVDTYGLVLSGEMARLVLEALPVVHLPRWLAALTDANGLQNAELYFMALRRCVAAGFTATFYDVLHVLRSRLRCAVPNDLLAAVHDAPAMAAKRAVALNAYDVHGDRWTAEMATAWCHGLVRDRPADALAHVARIVQALQATHTPVGVYNALLLALVQSDLPDRQTLALALFDAMVDKYCADAESARVALTVARDLGLAPRAKAILALLAARQWETSVWHYNAAIDACVRARDMAAALALFEAMPMKPTSFTFAVLFNGLSYREDTAAALALLDAMEAAHVGAPDIAGLFSLVRTFRSAPDQMLDVLARLATYPMDIGVYNGALDICRSHALVREAEQVLRLLGDHGAEPTTDTHALFLLTCANAKKFTRAMEYLATLTDCSVDVFNAAIEVCSHTRKPGEAHSLFEGMLALGIAPNERTYLRLFNALAPAGDVAALEDLFDAMPTAYQSPPLFNRMLAACFHARLPHAALGIYHRLEAVAAPTTVSVNSTLRALTTGRFPLANLESFVAGAEVKHGLAPDVITTTLLMRHAVAVGAPLECQRLFRAQAAPDDGCVLALLRAFAVADRSEWPLKELLAMFKCAETWVRSPHVYVALLRLVEAADDAVAILRRMEARGLHSAEACTLVMRRCNNAGQHAHVAAIFETMQRRGMYPTEDTYVEMLVALETDQQWVRATELFVQLTRKHPGVAHDKLARTAIGRYYVRCNSLPSTLPVADDDVKSSQV